MAYFIGDRPVKAIRRIELYPPIIHRTYYFDDGGNLFLVMEECADHEGIKPAVRRFYRNGSFLIAETTDGNSVELPEFGMQDLPFAAFIASLESQAIGVEVTRKMPHGLW